MRVPFANFRRTVDELRPELDAAIARVLDSSWFLLGREGEEFEREFRSWVGVAHAVGCASGTDAIELTLRAAGIGEGAEVVTQANTCVPTVAAIARAGATPVLCDVEPEAGMINPSSLERALSPSTCAVIRVHLYGQMGDMEAVGEVARAQRGRSASPARSRSTPRRTSAASATAARWRPQTRSSTSAFGSCASTARPTATNTSPRA